MEMGLQPVVGPEVHSMNGSVIYVGSRLLLKLGFDINLNA